MTAKQRWLYAASEPKLATIGMHSLSPGHFPCNTLAPVDDCRNKVREGLILVDDLAHFKTHFPPANPRRSLHKLRYRPRSFLAAVFKPLPYVGIEANAEGGQTFTGFFGALAMIVL